MDSTRSRLRFACLAWGFLALAADDDRILVKDAFVRYELTPGWTATGEAGEYWLDGEQDVASLLLLPPDPDMSLEERLAEIEAQFLSTGVIERESSVTREIEGDLVHVRRYRLERGGAGPVSLHQFSFVRADVRVLLQVETSTSGGDAENLFQSIYGSLAILQAPEPFDIYAPPLEAGEPDVESMWTDPEDFEAIVDSSDATIYEPDPEDPDDPDAGK